MNVRGRNAPARSLRDPRRRSRSSDPYWGVWETYYGPVVDWDGDGVTDDADLFPADPWWAYDDEDDLPDGWEAGEYESHHGLVLRGAAEIDAAAGLATLHLALDLPTAAVQAAHQAGAMTVAVGRRQAPVVVAAAGDADQPDDNGVGTMPAAHIEVDRLPVELIEAAAYEAVEHDPVVDRGSLAILRRYSEQLRPPSILQPNDQQHTVTLTAPKQINAHVREVHHEPEPSPAFVDAKNGPVVFARRGVSVVDDVVAPYGQCH